MPVEGRGDQVAAGPARLGPDSSWADPEAAQDPRRHGRRGEAEWAVTNSGSTGVSHGAQAARDPRRRDAAAG